MASSVISVLDNDCPPAAIPVHQEDLALLLLLNQMDALDEDGELPKETRLLGSPRKSSATRGTK